MRLYNYKTSERVRQAWRILATILVLGLMFLYSARVSNPGGQSVSVVLAIMNTFLGLWVLTWHPVLGTNIKGIYAFRFGMQLSQLNWNKITLIKKVYYKDAGDIDCVQKSSRSCFTNGRARWRVEIIGTHFSFFRICFSSNLVEVNDLISELNRKSLEFAIPIKTVAGKGSLKSISGQDKPGSLNLS